jgi:hypothetical protein
MDLDLWNQVHEVMEKRARRKGVPSKVRNLHDFPLAGRQLWHDGRLFTCFESSTRQVGRYRYYLAPSGKGSEDAGPQPANLATAVLHPIVIRHMREIFRNPRPLLDGLPVEYSTDPVFDEVNVIDALKRLDAVWGLFHNKTVAHLMLSLTERVTLYPQRMAIRWDWQGLAKLLRELRPELGDDQSA